MTASVLGTRQNAPSEQGARTGRGPVGTVGPAVGVGRFGGGGLLASLAAGPVQLKSANTGNAVQLAAGPQGAPSTRTLPNGSAPATQLAQLKSAYATLTSLDADDAQIIPLARQILAPFGVDVPDAAPGAGQSQYGVLNGAVLQARDALLAKLPATIADQDVTRWELDLMPDVNLAFAKYLVNNKKPHPDEQYLPELKLLDQLLGLHELFRGWWLSQTEVSPRSKRKPNAAGLAAATFALSLVGLVDSKTASGETAEVPNGPNGKPTQVKACVGHQLFRQILEESVDPTVLDLTVMLDPDKKKASWCGIFVNWVLIQAGLASSLWQMGGANVDYKQSSTTNFTTVGKNWDPQPGDVAYANAHNDHECIVLRVVGNTVYSIDGNSSGSGSPSGGAILAQARDKDWFSNIYEWK